MDKIYSRRRIIIPKLIKGKRRKHKKFPKFVSIIFVSVLTVYTVMKLVSPVFDDVCAKEASTIAISIITKDAGEVLKKYNYQDILSIDKNNNANILKTDVVVINNIATEITGSITNSLKNIEKEDIKIPIGVFTGNKFLTGIGPDINIKVVPVGTVNSEIKTEFKAQGINQTIYRIFLEINCEIKILMPYKSINRQIKNQILLVETAIVGDVPETYYNLESMTKEDTVKLID